MAAPLYRVYIPIWDILQGRFSNRASQQHKMMTPSNGNIYRVTGPLWGESIGNRWIPLTKASDEEPWYFLWSVPEQTLCAWTNVIWDAMAPIMVPLWSIQTMQW